MTEPTTLNLDAIENVANDLRGMCSDEGYRAATAIVIGSATALVAEVRRLEQDAALLHESYTAELRKAQSEFAEWIVRAREAEGALGVLRAQRDAVAARIEQDPDGFKRVDDYGRLLADLRAALGVQPEGN